MLRNFRISNFLLIDELELELESGLTTMTGETGAGKSIILGALRLVLGERADLQQIKNQEQKCVIEAVFVDYPEAVKAILKSEELDCWDELILRREISPSGNSRAFINDTPVRLDVLKQLSPLLIDIHSQFSTADILDHQYQLNILDAVAGLKERALGYRNLFKDRQKLQRTLEEYKNQLQEKESQKEYQNFLYEELAALRLKDPEEQLHLENELKLLENAENILSHLQTAHQFIDEEQFGLSGTLGKLLNEINQVASMNPQLEDISQRIGSLRIELADIEQEIEIQSNEIEVNPEKILQYRERLNEIYRLQQKHHCQTIEDLIEVEKSLSGEQESLLSLEKLIAETEQDLISQENTLREMAHELHDKRKSIAQKVEQMLLDSLVKLGMEKSEIKFSFDKSAQLTADGFDIVRLLFSSNPGMPLSELAKTVSGGERSRIMFAVKKMLAEHQNLPTIIFDEIDTGISGRIAAEMGNMMSAMGKNTQMMTITHLPQMAAKGAQHYKVYKLTQEESTQTKIEKLDHQGRKEEIAAMLSGTDVSDSAISQAEKLLQGF